MKFNKYTEQQLRDACAASKSYRNVMSILQIKESGGNYKTIQNKVKILNIDVSHFTGMGWNVGLKFKPNPPIPLKDILKKDSNYQSNKLRNRLIKENYFEKKCYSCGLTEWMNKPITLELEHVNGDHSDNTIENLTLLCPNCHSLTLTWRGRKLKLGSALSSALPVKSSPNLKESH